MTDSKKAAERGITALALELVRGSKKRAFLNTEDSVLRLKQSLDATVTAKATDNKEVRRKSEDMASKHFIS